MTDRDLYRWIYGVYSLILAVILALGLMGCASPPALPPPPIPNDPDDRWGVGWVDPQGWIHNPRSFTYNSNDCWRIVTETNLVREADGFWYFSQRKEEL